MANHGAFDPTKDVLGRADGRVVDERSHGDMDKGAVADDEIQERPAAPCNACR